MGQPAQRITLIAPDDVATAVYRLTKNQSLARAVANSAAMVMRDDIIDAVKVEKGMIGLEEYALAAHRRRQHANQVIAEVLRRGVSANAPQTSTDIGCSQLARNMAKVGRLKPGSDVEAHHVVAKKVPNDWCDASRDILRAVGLDLDHEANGVWLPSYKRHVPHPLYPFAYAHRPVHHKEYFFNVQAWLTDTIADGLDRQAVTTTLRAIGERLQTGTFLTKQAVA
ncbi:MAG: AHH domain-containing protein [Gammaproteobacteria bacterium]|nr:AHH domain-containing protein [Gammaproteobacteria bacterium]